MDGFYRIQARLLLSGGMLVASLMLYLVFLWYSWWKLERTFDEEEAKIDRLEIPKEEKSGYDFGGWDRGIVVWKKRLRYGYLCCCSRFCAFRSAFCSRWYSRSISAT